MVSGVSISKVLLCTCLVNNESYKEQRGAPEGRGLSLQAGRLEDDGVPQRTEICILAPLNNPPTQKRQSTTTAYPCVTCGSAK